MTEWVSPLFCGVSAWPRARRAGGLARRAPRAGKAVTVVTALQNRGVPDMACGDAIAALRLPERGG